MHIWEDGLLKFKIAQSQFPEYTWSLWQRRKTLHLSCGFINSVRKEEWVDWRRANPSV